MISTIFLVLFATIGYLLYKYFTRNFDYWEKKKVPHLKPIPFFGNYYDVAMLRITIGEYFAKLYNLFDKPFFGVYILNKPILVVKSPEMLKAILVKDFHNFCDRTIVSDEKCDPICSKLLFLIKNPAWRTVRAKMTPAFTTGKMRGMLELINEVSDEMADYLTKNESKNFIEAKELSCKYTTDVIATCAFGIKADSFKNENAEFRAVGEKMFGFRLSTALRHLCYFMNPKLVEFFKIRLFHPGVNEFLRDVFWKTINLREETNAKRKDLIDILINMRKEPDHNLDFSGDMVVAQPFMFFAAGFETTSTTMAFTFYELALSPYIQNRARSEVKKVIKEHGGFTYEALANLKYLHMVICESLRKYPALPFLDRQCIEDYKLPDTDIVIDKGTSVFIPMFGIHYDPNIYPEPEKFDPERFSEENRKNLPSFSFLPFGEGPRNCLGERFGLMSAKSGVAHVLLKYEIEKCPNTPVPVVLEPKSLVLGARGGLPLKFKKIVSQTN